MKKTLLLLLFLFPIFCFSQNKKEKIAILENRLDSCVNLLTDRLNTINRQNEVISNENQSIIFLNHEVDSLISQLNLTKVQTENQNNSIKQLHQQVDSLKSILLKTQDELNNNSKLLIDFSNDSNPTMLKLATEEKTYTDIDGICPIGWSDDGVFFAYVYSYAGGAVSESKFYLLNTKNNTINIGITINSQFNEVDSNELFLNNQILNSILKTYKIFPQNNFIAKKSNELNGNFGIRFNITKKQGKYVMNKFSGISTAYLLNYKATISHNNGNIKTILENNPYEKEDIIDILDGGYITSPKNDKIIIFMIKETGPGFENYNHWDISLYPIDLKNPW